MRQRRNGVDRNHKACPQKSPTAPVPSSVKADREVFKMGAPTHITTDHVHPHFDGTLPPVAVVDQDECFTLQTVSLPTGPSELPPHVVDALLVPVTGPVAVRG